MSDFDILNIDSDVVLPQTDFFANYNGDFDLGSFVIDQNTSLALPSSWEPTPNETEANKDVFAVCESIAPQNADTPIASKNADTPTASKNAHTPTTSENTDTPIESQNTITPIATQNTFTSKDTVTAANSHKRKNKIKQYKEESSSESDDDTCNRASKKRKEDNDPLWHPVTAQSNSSNAERTVNGQKSRLGRGRDFATLYKCYKPTSDNDNYNLDYYRKLIKENSIVASTSGDNLKCMKETPVNKPNTQKKECYKDNVKENIPEKKSSGECDFAKFISSTMKILPKKKCNPPSKPNNVEKRNRLRQYTERLQILDRFKTVLSERTAQSKQPMKPTVHQIQADSGRIAEKLTEKKVVNEKQADCGIDAKYHPETDPRVAEPVSKRKISLQENVTPPDDGKRKITVQEYLRRRIMATTSTND